MIRLKALDLSIEDGTADWFPADPEILQRVLQNFLTNALGYTPEGGATALKAEEDGEGGWVVL